MPAEVRAMERKDIDDVVTLWAQYVPRTQFAELEFVPHVARVNITAAFTNRNYIKLVSEIDGAVTGFCFGRVEYWLFNNRPFLAEVALYPGLRPTGAAGLTLMRELQRELDKEGIEQQVVSFYSGLEQEKIVALAENLGYTKAGDVFKKGI